jgi:hypothetical protein
MDKVCVLRLWAACLIFASCGGKSTPHGLRCGEGTVEVAGVCVPSDGGPDSDTDSDSDVDTDVDGDVDTDSDSDVDTDSDSDSDSDTDSDTDTTVNRCLDGEAWHLETVDAPGDTGYYPRIAVTDSGVVHVLYYDSTFGEARHATDVSGVWATDTVDSAASLGGILIDDLRDVHAVYEGTGAGGPALRHAVLGVGAWEITDLDVRGSGIRAALILAADGSLRVTHWYSEPGSGVTTFRYASDASGWAGEDVRLSAPGAACPAVDGDSVYVGHASNDLRLETRDADGWHDDYVDTQAANACSMFVTADGVVTLLYVATGYELTLGENDGSGWTMTLLEPNVSWVGSSVMDSDGSWDIAYVTFPDAGASFGQLRYGTYVGGVWATELVDAAEVAEAALALDDSGVVHIAYRDPNETSMRYARQCD